MRKIKVLVVDDSVVVRRLVSDALAEDAQIEVIGIAANGRIALAKVEQINPDILTMDIEMPEMDGLQTLAALRKTHPRLPVVMFSTLTERGGVSTLDALALGANDYVTKPSNVGNVMLAKQRIQEELIPKLKALCPHLVATTPAPVLSVQRQPLARSTINRFGLPSNARHLFEILVIGVSTGGPNALAELIPALPATFPIPVVIVQHMPPLFTKLLAERLNTQSPLKVAEAVPGAILQPGHVWLAPGGFHLLVERAAGQVRLKTNQEPAENSCRPAVDVLFRSAAQVYGAGVLAVVLTGMGQDGLRGCEELQAVGGQVLVQDEATSVVWGMPGFVAQAGLAEKVLPLPQIAPEILRRVPVRPTAAPGVSASQFVGQQ